MNIYMKKLVISLLLLGGVFYTSESYSQTKVDPSEITSTVPELSNFHDIIYPMWHDAYPAKDFAALKGFVPKIKSYMEAINKAKLPGILREKETAWKIQLNDLNSSAQNYYSAASGSDNNALLTATEKLHTSYEKMARVLRPALKELDDFHQTLYIIYHKLLPDGKYGEISAMTGTLITKAEAIKNYPQDKLKTRLGENAGKYDGLAKKLYTSTQLLAEALKGNDTNKKKESVESMHSAYEQLDSLFK
jgi:hypothetical protein